MTTTATAEKPAATRTRPKSRTARAAELSARDAAKTETAAGATPQPASRQRKTGNPKADRAAATPQPKTEPTAEATAPPAPEPADKPLTATARKRIVAAAAIHALADLAEAWADERVPADEARAILALRAGYFPGTDDTWDERLGQRSDAGRRPKSA